MYPNLEALLTGGQKLENYCLGHASHLNLEASYEARYSNGGKYGNTSL